MSTSFVKELTDDWFFDGHDDQGQMRMLTAR